MADDPVKMNKTPEYRETQGVALPLGLQLIETSRGVIRAVDAPGYTTLTIKHLDPEFNRVGMFLYAPEEGGVGAGMIAQMTPTEARTMAASLLKLAAMLDPGKPN
ncbi:hypothetical protein [Sphingopyxis sp. 113P3]|uniref:hypothetical protein n=1 Tax=Sphingopyxis sp. (strain 113P3) TaxID=292913 RepID=UPI0006AD55FF|nr:hypothetical protein [Sphingopyxis sp. 113P3]ALC12528.1 hypothetical protein LH20_11250 [Sphingopyxis sp. 113P3]